MIDETLYGLARQLGEALVGWGTTLVTAESCTGGWVAEAITAIPGSSEWFEAGFVTYSNRSKAALLGVPEDTLARFGAVSEETVCAMSRGALVRTAAGWAIAISGIAGPTGGSLDKPVGTIWVNWTSRGGRCRSSRFLYTGDRAAIRRQSVVAALQGLIVELRS